MEIIAAADGSALGNPGPAGWAWYVDDDHWAAGGWPHGTNNQGELKAVVDLFQATAHLDGAELRVLCDSQYVINAVTKWMPGWKRRGWRKADGSPVLNLDLLTELDDAIAGRRYRFEWVKGHAGHPLNEAADQRARAVATAYAERRPIPYGPGWEGDVRTHRADTGAAEASRPIAEPRPDAIADVIAREQLLLEPGVRGDRTRAAELLHPEFAEFGASGRVWTRDALLESIGDDINPDPRFQLLAAESVAPHAILLTYRTADGRGPILRSSLWISTPTGWRLRFHQGTPVRSDPAGHAEQASVPYQATFDF